MNINTDNRINNHYIVNSLLAFFGLERGLLLTTRDLIFRPGTFLQSYLNGDRETYTPPISYAVLWVGIWAVGLSLINKWTGNQFEAGMRAGWQSYDIEEESEKAEQQKLVLEWLMEGVEAFIQYQNLFNIFMIPVLGGIAYLVYRKYQLFYAEHLVISCYTVGTLSVVSFAALLFSVISFDIAFSISLFVGIGYTVWIYADTFRQSNRIAIGRSVLLNVLYYMAAMVIMMVVLSIYLAIGIAKFRGEMPS